MADPMTPSDRAEAMTARAAAGIPEVPSYDDITQTKKVAHFALSIENFDRHEDEDYLSGVVYINGAMHHLGALQVVRNEDGKQVGTKDPFDRLEALSSLYDDMDPMDIPGVEGEWLVYMHPGG